MRIPVSFEVGWRITVSRTTTLDPLQEYWVVRGNFYSFRSPDIFYRMIVTDQPPITETIELAERKAVLEAIEEWGRPTPIVEK
jgi:hypothetical protein